MLLLADRGLLVRVVAQGIGDRRRPVVADPHRPAGPQPSHLEDLPTGPGWPSCAVHRGRGTGQPTDARSG